MTPGLPQVPCAAAEPGASGRTGHWAQKQPLLFSFSAAVLPGAVPSVLCSEAAPAHVPGTLRLLKTGLTEEGGLKWQKEICNSTVVQHRTSLSKQGKLVFLSSAVLLIHRKKGSDLVPCHCRLTQRITWVLWLGGNGSLYIKTLTFSFESLCV